MEKISKKILERRYVEKSLFKTIDGAEFESEDDALYHEKAYLNTLKAKHLVVEEMESKTMTKYAKNINLAVNYAEELKMLVSSLCEDIKDSESMTEAWNKIDRFHGENWRRLNEHDFINSDYNFIISFTYWDYRLYSYK